MRHLSFRLHPGQDLKREIETAAVQHSIAAGVLLSVVGGLDRATLRMADATPTMQNVKTWEEPFEIVSGTGTISKDGCHIHVALSDKEGRVVGGHLKDGCVVKYTAEVIIGLLDGVEFRREPDSDTGFPELTIADTSA